MMAFMVTKSVFCRLADGLHEPLGRIDLLLHKHESFFFLLILFVFGICLQHIGIGPAQSQFRRIAWSSVSVQVRHWYFE